MADSSKKNDSMLFLQAFQFLRLLILQFVHVVREKVTAGTKVDDRYLVVIARKDGTMNKDDAGHALGWYRWY
jgi:hypothetical protein